MRRSLLLFSAIAASFNYLNHLNITKINIAIRKKVIVKAYLSGGYTLKEIGDYFGKHYSTISRIVKSNE
ncbi:MAG: hypothetical protein GQ475_08185 [Methylococcaceae bacterium]|nr:hypothetical protein [Methylococcaceae bacterium]